MPRLESWRVIAGSLCGDIYDDPRYPNGTPIQTSPLRSLVQDEARTKNGVYELGHPSPLLAAYAAKRGMSIQRAAEDLVAHNEEKWVWRASVALPQSLLPFKAD